MDMNPFAELQQYQLGGALMGQPPVQGPATPQPTPELPMQGMPQAAPMPPRDETELYQRAFGWKNALQELQANPALSMMLLQMGLSLGAGRGGPGAVGDAFGALGTAGAMQEKFRQQQESEQLAQRKVGIDEREVAAREGLFAAQARNYDRLAQGGGGGGGGGSDTEALRKATAELKALGFGDEEISKIIAKKRWGVEFGQKGGLSEKDQLTWAQGIEDTYGSIDEKKLTEGQKADLARARRIKAQLFGEGAPERRLGTLSEEDLKRKLQGGGQGGGMGPLPATIQAQRNAAPVAPTAPASTRGQALSVMQNGLPAEINEKIQRGIPLTPQEQILLQQAQQFSSKTGMSH
jgi:hypothetical protein